MYAWTCVYDEEGVEHRLECEGIYSFGYPPYQKGCRISDRDPRFYDPGEDDEVEYETLTLDGQEVFEDELPDEWLNRLNDSLKDATLEYAIS